ncbi:MAG: accessory gene regulator B family protein, partial [Clostridiales bacterium]|nr:accessory gene regulator B family protein [Clostridiales bacterium]
MIKVFAQKIAVTMGAWLQVDRDRIEVFAYGLEIILGIIVQFLILIWLSLILNNFITTMVSLVAFASLRYFGGGVHLSTYYRCLIVGTSLLLALGKLSTIDISLEVLKVFSILAFLIGTFIIFRWVPAGTEKKQIKDKRTRRQQKIKTLFVLIMLFAVTWILIIQKLNAGAFAVVLGLVGSLFLITPW